MANNTRALQAKANVEEYDQKLSDIKRLTRGLEKFVNETLSLKESTGEWKSFGKAVPLDDELKVIARFSWAPPSQKVTFEFWNGNVRLKTDSQLDLRIVRRAHDNLDVLIELAEKICQEADLLPEFRIKMERFGM